MKVCCEPAYAEEAVLEGVVEFVVQGGIMRLNLSDLNGKKLCLEKSIHLHYIQQTRSQKGFPTCENSTDEALCKGNITLGLNFFYC